MNYGTYIDDKCVILLDNVLTIVEHGEMSLVRYTDHLQVYVPVKFSLLLEHVNRVNSDDSKYQAMTPHELALEISRLDKLSDQLEKLIVAKRK
jgi:hypothetical protein